MFILGIKLKFCFFSLSAPPPPLVDNQAVAAAPAVPGPQVAPGQGPPQVQAGHPAPGPGLNHNNNQQLNNNNVAAAAQAAIVAAAQPIPQPPAIVAAAPAVPGPANQALAQG